MESVQVEQFRELVGKPFSIEFNSESTLRAHLTEVLVLGKKFNQDSEAFSLLFETEQTDQYFTQSIVRIYHKDLFTMEVFASPKGLSQSSGKMIYEVIFN